MPDTISIDIPNESVTNVDRHHNLGRIKQSLIEFLSNNAIELISLEAEIHPDFEYLRADEGGEVPIPINNTFIGKVTFEFEKR